MCWWNNIYYEQCKHSVIVKVPYSCEEYTRHTYGPCQPTKSNQHRVTPGISYGLCPDCEELLKKYTNL
ncbi:uncharacterized protein CTHT_0072240 [Thermochaetoides thermophila DSM 1495]|jgi:hypothetical protein|uniref:Uncharacterized protein n=1 Tax=Chaetomium thermophilum (strain DSM 1495 / CBS 144.50 / IMI 039719) TaxID=759272 RepID=G0SFV2_CHATD|nr:hypothetical protein CTHT_0072240 [Thermochaetoides thermophila DSM 1495]EGS17867.1 hypothetical protein CTHT_0072240 [Thermochaetoides thermophila DSM 1495]